MLTQSGRSPASASAISAKNKNSRILRSGRPKLSSFKSVARSARLGHRRIRQFLLRDLPLQLDRPWRQLALPGLEQERIQAAAVIDGFERVGGDAQLDRAAERVGDQG